MKFQLLAGAFLASAAAVQALPGAPAGDVFNRKPPTEEEAAKWNKCTEDFIGRLGKSKTGTSEACVYVDCMGQVANEYNRGGVLGIMASVLGGPCAVINRINLK